MIFKQKQSNATICECGKTCFAPTSIWCVAIVDVEDAWLLQSYKWSASGLFRNQTFYATSDRYGWETGKSAKLHRAIMGHAHPQYDHKNGWGHDCRRANLRPATNTESARNKRKQDLAYATSKYKGVFRIGDNSWRAHITVDGRTINLGTFGFETDAAIAYNYHAAHYFGEYASLNDLSEIEYMHD
jgi:hypothetical protein